MTKDPKQSPLSLATTGRYTQIQWEKLTGATVLEASETGHTILHHAARQGYWNRVPKELRDRKYWKEAKNGTTVLISAFQGQDQHWVWVDKKSLTTKDILKKNDSGQSVAILAARANTFYLLPKKIVTLEVLQQEISNEDYDTVLHKIILSGQLSDIDKKFLTEEILSSKGNYGETGYHAIASACKAANIPKNLWTKSALLLSSDDNTTPLHHICQYNSSLIHKDITLEDLLVKGYAGVTPLHNWAEGPEWINIPEQFLTAETLKLSAKHEKDTPIDLILSHLKDVYQSGNETLLNNILPKVKRTLNKLDQKTLESLSSQHKNLPIQLLIKPLLTTKKVLKKLNNNQFELNI